MNPKNPEEPTTREEYEALSFRDSGYGIGEDDYDDCDDYEEEDDEE